MANQKGRDKGNDRGEPVMERLYMHEASGEFRMAVVKPAVVTYSRSGEYQGRRGRGDSVTVKAASKSQVRKYCRQNGFKPQTYIGSKGDWTADCRRPMPKPDNIQERDEGVQVEKSR